MNNHISSFSFLFFNFDRVSFKFNYITINPALVIQSNGTEGVEEKLPGTMRDDISRMQMPYGIYVNPYTGYMYATDAASFAEGGTLYQWTPQGVLTGKYGVYINPAHFLALPPDGHFTGIHGIEAEQAPARHTTYNLAGQPAGEVRHNTLYIKDGKKYIRK